jgi:phospholipid/cholesterol/gamma-HCH transport system substrate-binding protein
MQKQAPTLGRVLVMAIFALSCFSLLLYLWAAFGGAVPLKPHGYRFEASFSEAVQLAKEADVRISGVSVGKVRNSELGDDGRTVATIELKQEFAPLPSDTQAILRQKTLLGETYVELSPGTRSAKPVAEGDKLATANVHPTVELDEIFRSFDERTQAGFRTWMQQQGLGVRGRGADLNMGFGTLPDFAQTTNRLLRILNSQQNATRQIIRDTGVVFDALSERDGQLADWITNSNTVFAAVASRNEELAATWRNFPEFIDQSRLALDRLTEYAKIANPVLVDLRPVGRQLSRLQVNTAKFARDFKGLFVGLDRLVRVSRKGIPATIDFLRDIRLFLAEFDPFLRNFNPWIRYLGMNKHEIASFFANMSATSQARDNATRDTLSKQGSERYFRVVPPLMPESLSSYVQQLGSHRSNAYAQPGTFSQLAQGLDSFNTANCGNPGFPDLGPADESKGFSEDLRNRVLAYILNGQGDPPTPTTVAPPCKQQNPFTFGGATTQYPQVTTDPKPSNPYAILGP